MYTEEAVADDEAVSISPWHLAALHVSFSLLCVVATLALRSPLWLLLTLFYCGFYRDALVGRSFYPAWLWNGLCGCILLSIICSVGANALTLLVRADAVAQVVWQLLLPLWNVVGVQQWRAAELFETMLFPAITTVVLAIYVLYMKHQDTRRLRIRWNDVGSTLPHGSNWRVRWTRLASACHHVVAPLLAALAWVVAWLAPPSYVGLWLELMSFILIGSALYALHQTRVLSSSSGGNGSTNVARTLAASAASAAVITAVFRSTIAVLIVGVSATQNPAFTPFFNVYSSLCTQIGVGYMDVRSDEGIRRAVQLVSMAVLVAGAAAVQTHAMPFRTSPPTENLGLLMVAEEEEAHEREQEYANRGGGRHHVDNAVSQADPLGPQLLSQEVPQRRSFLFQTKHLFQAAAVACVLALLLHAVYFPNLVSLVLWMVHFCCCAGGLVSRPQRPSTALFWVLVLCFFMLSCAIVAQYLCVVLRANPSTEAWAWGPGLPYHVEDAGAVAVQVIGEHGIALLLGFYLCTRGVMNTLSETESNLNESGGDASLPAASLAHTTSQRLAEEERENGRDSPQINWMIVQLRNAAGSPKELRKVFEVAVGRSPRCAELDCLVASAQSATATSFSSVRHLNIREVFSCIASGLLYTYAIIISLFVLGTSSTSMSSMHAACLVLSLLFSIVGSNAVLYRRLRILPPVWVAVVMGLQLGYRVLAPDQPDPSSTASAWWGYVGISAFELKEAAPYLVVQPVLLWCYRYEPHLLTNWTEVLRCLVFRCRWTQLFSFVRRAAGVVVFLWIVLLLPRSVDVTLLMLLLLSAALLRHLQWRNLVYVWQRFLIVGYCGMVLLAMLLVEFAPMRPRLWRCLRALGCPVGSEGACARDVGLPSDTTVWLTPLSLPWWFVIVLATAAGTPYALPTSMTAASSILSPASSPSSISPTMPVVGALARWRAWCRQWWSQLLFTVLTVLLLFAMTYAALRHPSLLTAAYLVGPAWDIYPAWTLTVAAVHTALQCAYQFWFSPLWLDSYTLWGAPIAELIGLWKVTSTAASDDGSAVPSTLAVAAAPLLIGVLQALQEQQQPQPSTERTDREDDDRNRVNNSSFMFASPIEQALRRLCASHLYLLLLLCLLRVTQRCLMGWGVAVLLLVVWWAADLRECGVLLRPRWLYQLCVAATSGLAIAAYVLYWTHERFPHWPVQQKFPWAMGGSEGVTLSTVCWTAVAACVALQWSSGADSGRTSETNASADTLFGHPHSTNFISWLRQRIGRHRGTFGMRTAHSIAGFTPSQRDVFLTDAAELIEGPRNTQAHEADEGEEEREGGQQGDTALLMHAIAPSLCGVHAWSIAILQMARLVPVVACGFITVGAASPSSCLLTILLLLTGLLMALRHARLQWSFWWWWRSLLIACTALPLSALLMGCPPVQNAVGTLPPWVGLVIGLSDDVPPRVSGEGLRFTARHVALFFAFWIQSSLYNNPQWAVRLLRMQYAEKKTGEKRHVALQRQLESRVARATEEAMRVDREIRAYLDGLRAGNDMAEVTITSEGERGYGRSVEQEEEEGEDREEEQARWDEATQPLRALGAEMDVRSPPPHSPSPTTIEKEGRGESVETAIPASPSLTVALPSAEERLSFSTAAAAAASESREGTPMCSSAWHWWRRWCDSCLRRACNVLAAYTYHPSEYCVCATRAAAAAAAAPESGPALLSLCQLLKRLVLIMVQVMFRHTPLALLACALANALLTGCLWELLSLCYVVQIALSYHPYAPHIVYQCLGYYVMVGVFLKQLVMLWVTFNTLNSIPAFFAGTLLPLQKGSPYTWSSAAASRSSLRYHSLWMDVLMLGIVALHDRVCVVHGVYVDDSKRRDTAMDSNSAQALSSASVLPYPTTPTITTSSTVPSRAFHNTAPPSQDAAHSRGVRGSLPSYYANIVSVPGVGEDWYISYTSVDLLALFVLAMTYSHMTANEKLTLQDNVQNNQLPGPMALLLCMSVLQLVVDRMFFVQRCMRLKAATNWTCALMYCLLYWRWRNTVAVSAHTAGNMYFILKIVALVLSVTQVRRGFPLHRRRDAFTTHPGSLFRYSCFMVYRAIPFLWEVRTLIDWTVQHTALTLQEYLTLEDVHVYLYHCRERYVGKRNEHAKVGDAVPLSSKWLFGVSRLALILLALLGPLLYYSTYNPSAVVQKAMQLNFRLSFFGAHDFFSTTVHDNATVPDGWWSWVARTRPTLALYGQAATEQTVQLMEFASCSGSQWTASPQAMRQVLAGLRAAADAASEKDDKGEEGEGIGAAYILQSTEMTRSTVSATSSTSVSHVNRWRFPKATAQAMVQILEKETGLSTTTTPPDSNSSINSVSYNDSSDNGTTSAVLPFFYSPFFFSRASRLDVLATDARFPHRNRHHCRLELHHERDVALNTMVRYWCLHCAPLFPEGNVPSENTSRAAEWHCLTTGEGCDDFNYEDVNDTLRVSRPQKSQVEEVPIYMVVLSDSVVVGISLLKGIGIVALYTTFVLALGRLLRSLLANKVGTLVFENMACPEALENMVRCIGIAREYGDLRLEHTIYLELIDLLRSPERLFSATGPLSIMYEDAVQGDMFHLGQMRRRGARRRSESNGTVATGEEKKEHATASAIKAASS